MDKTIIKKIENYFENNPTSFACYITSDGQLFHSRVTSGSHSKGLDNTQIYYVPRGTNLEDWFEDIKRHEELKEEVASRMEEIEDSNPKWGWWNWLYKILN